MVFSGFKAKFEGSPAHENLREYFETGISSGGYLNGNFRHDTIGVIDDVPVAYTSLNKMNGNVLDPDLMMRIFNNYCVDKNFTDVSIAAEPCHGVIAISQSGEIYDVGIVESTNTNIGTYGRWNGAEPLGPNEFLALNGSGTELPTYGPGNFTLYILDKGKQTQDLESTVVNFSDGINNIAEFSILGLGALVLGGLFLATKGNKTFMPNYQF